MAVEWTGEAHMKVIPWGGGAMSLGNANHLDVSTAVAGQLEITGICWDGKSFAFRIGLG